MARRAFTMLCVRYLMVSPPLTRPVCTQVPDGSASMRSLLAAALCVIAVMAAAAVAAALVWAFRRRKRQASLISEAKLRGVKEQLERILNTAPVAFMMTVDGVVTGINQYMENHVGLAVGDASIRIYVDPAQREELIGIAMRQDMAENHIVWFHMADGSRHRFLSNVSSLDYEGRRGFILWGMDIEEQEKQKDQLRATHENLQTLLDTLPVGVRIMRRGDGALLYANQAALRVFGFTSFAEVCECTGYDYMPEIQPNGRKTKDIITEMNEPGLVASEELRCFKRTGEPFDARLTSHAIDYKNEAAFLAIIEDLTAEKEYQRMLHDTAEKEREANQLKSRFLVNMSHEIRTPMNAIMGLTEIELHKNPDVRAKEVYQKINTSAKNLLEIINDILDLSKIEADKMELYDDEFELEEVLSSALLVATPRLDGKSVEFMLNASLDLPQFVIGDRTRLWQILKNFLDNSAKYTEQGKIVLTAFVNTARSDEQTAAITFIVEDTGIGMGPDQLARAFAPYEQIRNDAQKRYSGTGLGMAISKQLVEMMGGELQVESNIGQGTTVILTIPFKRSENRRTDMQAVEVPALAGLEILAVDDDELSLHIMHGLLENSRAHCVLATSGMQAMDIVLDYRDSGKAFDLILLDYMMEGLNGLETARQIHMALSAAPKLLMVTAYQKLLLKHELEESGIDDVIEKPFIPSQFMHKLRAVLGMEDGPDETEETFTKYENVTVLLCEDYRLNQEVATGMFAQFGVRADVADNGQKGLALLYAGKPYDLIFMDLQMPVMDGYETTRAIRADRRYDSVPIVSLTADAMKEVTEKCLAMGMNDHIAKPMEFADLQRVFRQWLPESKRAAEVSPPPAAAKQAGLARFGGDKARYAKALETFAADLPAGWPDFAQAVRDEELGRLVHKIKGTAGNLAEVEIYQSATAFESSLRIGKPDRSLYERFISACGDAKRKNARQESARPSAHREEGGAEELASVLQSLKTALENYNPKATHDAVKALRAKSWPAADPEKLRQLCELSRKYEFDDALELLDAVNAQGGE